jgi:uncharacterized protein YdeI (YjbR/CyaY-like superfamily)
VVFNLVEEKMTARFFARQSDFRKWLEKNHDKKTELLVGFYKVDSGKPSITWPQSVDEALCFGWIDGVRRSIDKDSYCIRFSPRKRNSIWSAVNLKKIEALKRAGLMKPSGLAVFENRDPSKAGLYTYEKEEVKFSPDYERTFKANQKAWTFFQSRPPSYRRPATNWVMSAKEVSTQLSRLERLIAACEAGRKLT